MKVVISVGGRFHAFYLAEQLARAGHLERLITSYPRNHAVKYGIPREKIQSVIIKEIIERAWNKLPHGIRGGWNPQYIINRLFDRLAARKVVSSDIFVGWAGQCLESLRSARQKGAITIVERGSTHIMYQNEILQEEYARWNIPVASFQAPHPKVIEQELQEYKEADYIAIPSSFVKKTFIEKGIPEEKLIQIPYGVNIASFRKIPKEDDIFRIIFAGGMSLRKGVHYILEAYAGLNLPKSELLLIGSLNDEIKPFFKKYEGKFKWIGHIPQSELYRHYSQGSVFVMASIEEGLGLVQLQAMACGLPVIATKNTGAKDIIRDGKDGFIVPIRDVNALQEKITYLYTHPDIQKKMGSAAEGRIRDIFTWDNYGKKVMTIYKEIIEKRKKQL